MMLGLDGVVGGNTIRVAGDIMIRSHTGAVSEGRA